MTTEQKLELVFNKCNRPEIQSAVLDSIQKEIDLLAKKETIKKQIDSMSAEQKEALNIKLEAKVNENNFALGLLGLFLVFIFIYGLVQFVMLFIP